jgi:K+-sensing histidine kinase KdpD
MTLSLDRELQMELAERVMRLSTDAALVGAGQHPPSDRLSRLLVALDQLSRLHQSDAFQAGERMSLWQLVQQLVDETPLSHCDFYITPQTQSKSESDSVIYGDATLLETSLRTLMAAVAESAPAHSQVEMRVRLNGGYIALSSHFSNAPVRHTTHHKENAEPAKQALQFDSDIGRQICRRVVEMHGGLLTITETDRATDGVAGVESFVATFPLSAPLRAGSSTECGNCPIALQMEKYARDIAFLLTRPTALAPTSQQEIQMLTKLLYAAGSRDVPQ